MSGQPTIEIVKRMWIDYREQGVETALALCHPDVEFQDLRGRVWTGHEGIRGFFAQFGADDASSFAASPYTFEPAGDGVIVAGHGRIQSGATQTGEYMYFAHHVTDGLVVRAAAFDSREAAMADLGAST